MSEDTREYTRVVLDNVIITGAWSESNKVGFRRRVTTSGKDWASGKLEQFSRAINGKFQDDWLFSCWIPELFDKLEAMSKSDHTFTVVGKSTTTNNDGKRYKNFIIMEIPDQPNL